MAKLSVVPKTSPGALSMDSIPQEFRDEIEQAYEALRSQGDNFELRVEFDDVDERKAWLKMAKSYGEQRTTDDGSAARLKIYAVPKRGLPDTVAFVKIAADLPANGAENTHRR